MNEWISVEDRLPDVYDTGSTFICATTAGGLQKGVMPLTFEALLVNNKSVKRWLWNGRKAPWEVTHWMPLPESPEGENTNERT